MSKVNQFYGSTKEKSHKGDDGRFGISSSSRPTSSQAKANPTVVKVTKVTFSRW